MPQLHIFAQPSKLFAALTAHLVDAAETTLNRHERFSLALSGGSTPAPFYQYLAHYLVTHHTNLSRWYFFLVDERVVPVEHADSNYGMIKRHLFDLVALPPENLFPIVTAGASATQCAQRYTEILNTWLPHTDRGLPQLDYLLLGLGADGHTASLFPGDTPPSAAGMHVVPVSGDSSKLKRVSLAASVLRAARQRVFLVTGTTKANIVHQVLKRPLENARLPAVQIIQDLSSDWFLDTAAAELLSDKI